MRRLKELIGDSQKSISELAKNLTEAELDAINNALEDTDECYDLYLYNKFGYCISNQETAECSVYVPELDVWFEDNDMLHYLALQENKMAKKLIKGHVILKDEITPLGRIITVVKKSLDFDPEEENTEVPYLQEDLDFLEKMLKTGEPERVEESVLYSDFFVIIDDDGIMSSGAGVNLLTFYFDFNQPNNAETSLAN